MCLFQFLTFAERLANVNIDVIHRIDRTGSYAEVCTINYSGNMSIPLIFYNRLLTVFMVCIYLSVLLMQEVETYFSEGLSKWRDLNLTEHFSTYKLP